ncbi:hypothetical protein NQ317_014756 [Molorchus minor]|uniref:Uncharacterized protein n=1 Tax=Molorchus minor TaxID=1323400 RepID=A0ABQ9IY50_9CUCU|nr:hypothetical protein NQ317_014756 [Molorchus minor]
MLEGEGIQGLEEHLSPRPPKVKKRVKKEEAHTLEEDLQFSSEEELDEVPLNEFEDDQKGILISAELPMETEGADDDSQQAAEAMVQLGTMGYYQQTEGEETLVFKGIACKWRSSNGYPMGYQPHKRESMDVDPNYDPSEFLMSGLPLRKVDEPILPDEPSTNTNTYTDMKIHDDLAVSESEDEGVNISHSQELSIQEEDDGGDLWF